ncbi:MAG: conjugal transfer protein TraF, partial [Acidobacteriota bacterium]|nr:conjugal transfer protein TraF [Acidobacteriota bacterium]
MLPIRSKGPAVPGLLVGLLLVAGSATGQTLGTRAAGMAEAFVAVADDATSVFWNPAGMATGALFSVVVDFGDATGPAGAEGPDQGEFDDGSRFVGFTVPPLGVAYYRLSRLVADPAATDGLVREDGRRSVRGLTTSNIGVTLAQSVTDVLVIAGTVKLVTGTVSGGTVEAPDAGAALEAARSLPERRTTRGDVDGGLMVSVNRWRAGLVARNLTTPSFQAAEPNGETVDLDREVRVGAA